MKQRTDTRAAQFSGQSSARMIEWQLTEHGVLSTITRKLSRFGCSGELSQPHGLHMQLSDECCNCECSCEDHKDASTVQAMIQRDYILRLIDQLGALLRALLSSEDMSQGPKNQLAIPHN